MTAEPRIRSRRLPGARLLACVVDWACILVWVAITAAIGIPLFLAGVTDGLSIPALNVVATIVLVLPVTVGLALLEASSRESTLGKRVRRLRVVDASTGSPVPFGRTLLRNVVKVAIPWTLGHAAVYALVASDPDAPPTGGVWVLTAAAYALPIVYVVSLFGGDGRTPYDRLARTRVLRDDR
ncbi:RDD family protein [Leifsonia sp. NPDC058248]|uniref:RDD family protein n=1 Tax=Leifsonia sp. NPDC058248 TaxID=3346402 RepID=UPI0036DEA3FF